MNMKKKAIKVQVEEVVIFKYPCTSCGGDAEVGTSYWKQGKKIIIGKNERLCLNCHKKRTGFNVLGYG